MEVNDGQGSRQGWAGQEGQPQEGPRQEGSLTPIYDLLAYGGVHLVSDPAPELCQVCHTPDGEQHTGRRHAFAPPGTRVDTSQFGAKRSERRDEGRDRGERRHGAHSASQTSPPFDPVLRKALIDKGVISMDDLDRASREIQAFTQAVTGGYDAGTGTRTVRSDAAGT